MPDGNILARPPAAPLTGTERFYAAQGALDVQATGDQIRDLAARGLPAQCRLTRPSTAQILLSPFNGNLLTVNALARVIPDAGVALAPTGLTPLTLYYVYAWMNGAALALEASVTVPVVQAGTGIKVKTGDASRTLVGMVRPDAGPVFTDDGTVARMVRSYYNRPRVQMRRIMTGTNASTASNVWVECSAAMHCDFLMWSDEAVTAALAGAGAATGGIFSYFAIPFDGESPSEWTKTTSPTAQNISLTVSRSGFADGLHWVTPAFSVDAGSTAGILVAPAACSLVIH